MLIKLMTESCVYSCKANLLFVIIQTGTGAIQYHGSCSGTELLAKK
jgi:hypothetical protein